MRGGDALGIDLIAICSLVWGLISVTFGTFLGHVYEGVFGAVLFFLYGVLVTMSAIGLFKRRRYGLYGLYGHMGLWLLGGLSENIVAFVIFLVFQSPFFLFFHRRRNLFG